MTRTFLSTTTTGFSTTTEVFSMTIKNSRDVVTRLCRRRSGLDDVVRKVDDVVRNLTTTTTKFSMTTAGLIDCGTALS